MKAEKIIYNGRCLDVVKETLWDWVAISGEIIIATGNGDEYSTLKGEKTLMINANGRSVLPGFIDSHFHLLQTAMNSDFVNLSNVSNYRDIGNMIKAYASQNLDKEIFCFRLDEGFLKEGKYPDRKTLDQISGDKVLWISNIDYQVSMLNTYGLLFYKIPYRLHGIESDSDGVATGIFKGSANAALRTNILNKYEDRRRMQNVTKLIPNILSNGITTINAMEGGYMYSDKDANFVYENYDTFPIDVFLFYQTHDLDQIQEMGLSRVGGSLYIDGTMGARTAALSFEYNDMPGHMGRLLFSQDEINEFVLKCYERNLQLSLYTIGDRAIELVLNAHEYAIYKSGIRGLRHRLEHVELATKEQIQKASDMGIIFSMNPTYELYWGGKGKMYEDRLGDKYIRTNRFRDILDAGVKICAGSDSDVCEMNPFLGIHAVVNHPVGSSQGNIFEAIRMYTSNGAYAIFEEKIRGNIREGMLADLIILDRDVLSTPSDILKDIKVDITIKSGEMLFNRAPLQEVNSW
ncbi:amidohydrolase [Eubacteriales bacterium KG127]